jgi:hypothetical protein
MLETEVFLESKSAGGTRLRITFVRRGDRYGHRLSAVLVGQAGGESIVPLAESVEGTSDDPWPPSPPLQSVSIEKLPDGRTVALLVGMAGRSHWSASIEEVREQCGVQFDLACRCQAPGTLGSQYAPLPGAIIAVAADGSACVWNPARDVAVTITAGNEVVSLAALARGEVPHVCIIPSAMAGARGATIRWQYRAKLLPEDEARRIGTRLEARDD